MSFRLATTAILLGLGLASAAQAADAPQLQAHLASYKDRANAEKGWHQIAEQYSSVLYFTPQLTEVDLPGKGRFLRLYAEGDEELMRSLCTSMKAKKLYCALTDGDGKFLRP